MSSQNYLGLKQYCLHLLVIHCMHTFLRLNLHQAQLIILFGSQCKPIVNTTLPPFQQFNVRLCELTRHGNQLRDTSAHVEASWPQH